MPREIKAKIRRPLILEIRGNSLDDGPGIRSVVFFKGCPLSCVWCHNPESKRAAPEIGFDKKECIGCGTCSSTCTAKAVSNKNHHFVDRSRCTLCFECVDTCPSGALSRVGTKMSVDEIVSRVLIDKPFFVTSGGGVTLSGGEPAMFMEFTSELLKALKKNRIHTGLDTCGFFDFKKFADMLLPHLNMIYYDIKIIDDDMHRTFTGASNARILDNFARLREATMGSEVTLLPRMPLVPGITDTEYNLKGTADFLARLGVKNAALMQYNPLWYEKSDKVGADTQYRHTEWMDRRQVDRCYQAFQEAGIEVMKQF